MSVRPRRLLLLEHQERINEQFLIGVQNGIEPIITHATNDAEVRAGEHFRACKVYRIVWPQVKITTSGVYLADTRRVSQNEHLASTTSCG